MTQRRDLLAARLAALPPAASLELVCHGAVDFLDVRASAVILMSSAESGTVAASYGPRVVAVEDLQFTLGEGPCLTSFRDGVAVLEPDLAHAAGRWPAFAPAAVAAGVRAVFALPLRLGAIRLGVLYLVRERPGPLAEESMADAHGLAELATVMILEREQDGPGVFAVAATQDSWAHRAVVHQATGMVSAQLGVALADALARLRARAYALDRSIYAVSVEVVDRRLRFFDGDKGTIG